MMDVDEQIDTSDLDLLDDAARHARCTFCQPGVKAMQPFVALCGTRAAILEIAGDPLATPPNACGPCSILWYAPCARCGK